MPIVGGVDRVHAEEEPAAGLLHAPTELTHGEVVVLAQHLFCVLSARDEDRVLGTMHTRTEPPPVPGRTRRIFEVEIGDLPERLARRRRLYLKRRGLHLGSRRSRRRQQLQCRKRRHKEVRSVAQRHERLRRELDRLALLSLVHVEARRRAGAAEDGIDVLAEAACGIPTCNPVALHELELIAEVCVVGDEHQTAPSTSLQVRHAAPYQLAALALLAARVGAPHVRVERTLLALLVAREVDVTERLAAVLATHHQLGQLGLRACPLMKAGDVLLQLAQHHEGAVVQQRIARRDQRAASIGLALFGAGRRARELAILEAEVFVHARGSLRRRHHQSVQALLPDQPSRYVLQHRVERRAQLVVDGPERRQQIAAEVLALGLEVVLDRSAKLLGLAAGQHAAFAEGTGEDDDARVYLARVVGVVGLAVTEPSGARLHALTKGISEQGELGGGDLEQVESGVAEPDVPAPYPLPHAGRACLVRDCRRRSLAVNPAEGAARVVRAVEMYKEHGGTVDVERTDDVRLDRRGVVLRGLDCDPALRLPGQEQLASWLEQRLAVEVSQLLEQLVRQLDVFLRRDRGRYVQLELAPAPLVELPYLSDAELRRVDVERVGLDLKPAYELGEQRKVSCSLVADAVLPDHVHERPDLGRELLDVVVPRPVVLGREQQVRAAGHVDDGPARCVDDTQPAHGGGETAALQLGEPCEQELEAQPVGEWTVNELSCRVLAGSDEAVLDGDQMSQLGDLTNRLPENFALHRSPPDATQRRGSLRT
jgi:hypothetical protein